METKHPIESLMITSMSAIESMVDVNTIVGDAITSSDGTVIIPLSKVSFGFAAGGSEFNTNRNSRNEEITKLPFGGGSGAGVKITPIGFIVIKDGKAKVLNVDGINVVDRVMDLIPDVICKLDNIINKKMDNKDIQKEEKKIIKNVDINTGNVKEHYTEETTKKE